MHEHSGYVLHALGEQEMSHHFQVPQHEHAITQSAAPRGQACARSSSEDSASALMANGKTGSGGHLSNQSTQSSEPGEPGDSDSFHNGHIQEVLSPKERRDAWWSIDEFADRMGVVARQMTHQSAKLTLTGNRVFGATPDEEVWDLSDSLAELYEASSRAHAQQRSVQSVDVHDWLVRDSSNGFIRVYAPDMACTSNSQLVPCTLSTTAHKLSLMLGLAVNALHIQLNGDTVRRLDPYEHPLVLQNEYLAGLGYSDVSRIQHEGVQHDLQYLVKFYSGKPMVDSTFSRSQLQAYIDVKKGKVMSNWVKRLCVISGTRLLIHKDKHKKDTPSVVQLAKGQVEEVEDKGHAHVLKLTCTLHGGGERLIYLAFTDTNTYHKWYRKCKKATDKLPTCADLSHCHLEFLPETVFINDQLAMLNLRHNVLKERPIEEDIYTIGWLDDLPRFTRLRSLNLADNNLVTFPLSLCSIRTLVELNVASNKLEEIPPDIALLNNLQALHVHNNHLSSLPGELTQLSKLFILVLAFNRFIELPAVVARMTDVRVSEVENIIMAGNQLEALPEETLLRMKYVKKADFRMNCLTLAPSETLRFTALEHLTHLDVRDNLVTELDVRAVRTLEYLNVERNSMVTLQLNGMQLKNLFAANNRIERLSISPKPEWLLQIDLSYNMLRRLPDWLSDCFFLQKINASHNFLTELPPRLLVDAKKLKSLRVAHNRLVALPAEVEGACLEELHVQHNLMARLPNELLSKLNKLRVLNVTKNRLQMLPELNSNVDLNKVQELYLSHNMLGDAALEIIAGYRRLKVLHIAHNEIHNLYDRDLKKLDLLQELNISGNQLRSLPHVLGALSKLVILRAHSNVLQNLPDFKQAASLRILDLGHNQLLNVSVTNLMASQLNLLDMSLNAQLKVDPREFKTVKHRKSVCLVDSSGQNRVLPGLHRRAARPDPQEHETDPSLAWKVGFSETSGIRNKLCIANLRILKFENENESLFGMFDGGHNNEVPKLLLDKMPSIVRDQLRQDGEGDKYMKYSMLTAHRKLGAIGQKLGACAMLCHIRCVRGGEDSAGREAMNSYSLHMANVGDTELVLCRRGEALCLTRRFTTSDDPEECHRVYSHDGIITEDNKVNGTTKNTRCVGNSYLYPHVIPEPYTASIALRHDDEFLIIANRGLWRYVSYAEAVEEVYEIGNPVVAAKRLQDMAQGYGSKENIGILVVRLNTDRGPSLARLRQHKSMSIDDVQAAAEFEERRVQLQQQRSHDGSAASSIRRLSSKDYPAPPPPVGAPKQRPPSRQASVDFNPASRQQSRELKPASRQQSSEQPREGEPDQLDSSHPAERSPSPRSRSPKVMRRSPQQGSPQAASMSPLPELKPLPNQRYRKKTAAREWESILQSRLSEEVKERELRQVSRESVHTTSDSPGHNIDLADPHAKPRRVITQPPYLSPQANPMLLVPALEESQSGSGSVLVRNYAHTDSSEQHSSPARDDPDKDKSVRNTIALFENMNQLPPQPDVDKKTTVVVIERDERGPPSPRQDAPPSPQHDHAKYNVEVLKFQGATSVEGGAQGGVAGHVGSTEIRVQQEEDEQGEVRIVEIARL